VHYSSIRAAKWNGKGEERGDDCAPCLSWSFSSAPSSSTLLELVPQEGIDLVCGLVLEDALRELEAEVLERQTMEIKSGLCLSTYIQAVLHPRDSAISRSDTKDCLLDEEIEPGAAM
jgi:hypothetical protein